MELFRPKCLLAFSYLLICQAATAAPQEPEAAQVAAAHHAVPDYTDSGAMRELERQGAMELGSFFDEDKTPRKDGQLIRSESAEGYDLPAGWHATRILYRSRDVKGSPTTASAVVATPPGKAPANGWPLVVWAHGTTGVARQCGPSAMKGLGYYTQELAKAGFAVLVVDYAGLSTRGPAHQYMTKISNATDVVNAVPAARQAVKSLANTWVAVGHSQGGQAVWGVAELEADRKDQGYLGGIALAPAVGGDDLMRRIGVQSGQMFYTVYMAHTIKVQFPEFDISTVLTPAAMAEYKALTSEGCYFLAAAEFSKFTPGTALKPGWDKQPEVAKFIEMNSVGKRPIKGPLFIASGEADTAVPAVLVEHDARRQCEAGGNVFYKAYPGDHGTMMASSYADQIAWLKDRFAGKPAVKRCP